MHNQIMTSPVKEKKLKNTFNLIEKQNIFPY